MASMVVVLVMMVVVPVLMLVLKLVVKRSGGEEGKLSLAFGGNLRLQGYRY